MPVARKCSFCGGRVEPGTGLMFVRRDGSVLFFCSSKCERNFKLNRKPHRVKWTERSRKARGKA
ncbi:MAG: 50S ribosomal protein L24e [Hadesarchaea archaeon]|nr:MAG: 50S ribosomal protein L24e [Hadesarchaea archaeon]